MRRSTWAAGCAVVMVAAGAIVSPAWSQFRTDDPPDGGGCDNGGFSVTVTGPPGGLETSEFGTSDNISVVMPNPILHPVYVLIKAEDPTEAVLYNSGLGETTTRYLYFDRYNWYVPQQVTIRGKYDCERDGNVQYAISAYGPYSTTCASGGVSGVNVDVPVARIETSPATPVTSEGGATTRVNVRLLPNLLCSPTSGFAVTVTSNDLTEGLVKLPGDPVFGATATLQFTAAGYNVYQPLDIAGQRDGIPDGNVWYGFGLATYSTESAWNGLLHTMSAINNDTPLADDSCYTRCGRGIGQVGGPPAGCSCAADCGYQGNCCADVIAECSGIGGSPQYPDPLSFGAGSEFYVASPIVGTSASSSSDAPQGTGAVVSFSRPVGPISRSVAGLTKIDPHMTETHEERAECHLDQVGGFWSVRSWVNWALDPDAYVSCAARSLTFPVGLATPPSVRNTAHAQDVGAQSPQTVSMGPATANSIPVLTGMKIENVRAATHTYCQANSSGGNWVLHAEGDQGVSDVWCDAQVLTWDPASGLTAGPNVGVGVDYNSVAEREVYLGPARDRACFLTQVTYAAHNGYPGGGGTCEVFERNDGAYIRARRDPVGTLMAAVGCHARCIQFSGASWPPAPTLRGVVGPGETPAPGTDISITGSAARVNLYQSGAYDKPLVLVEGFDPVDTSGPDTFVRLLSAPFRRLMQAHGVDIWIANVSGAADIIGTTSREVARAIGIAYTYDPDGAGPLQPWNVAHPGQEVAVAGFSQGGVDTRLALASWEDGSFGPAGAWPIPGLPNAGGPPPVGLFLSVNAPVKGAEAPMTLQHLVHDVGASLEDAGISLPPEVSQTLHSAPARQMLRHQGCDNAWGVVTEWCGYIGLWGNRTVQGPEDDVNTTDLPLLGNEACIFADLHPDFQAYSDARGARGNGFPQSVYSVGFSNGSFSPQGCANIDQALPCPGEPLAWASGTGPGSVFSTIHLVDTGHWTPTGDVCERNVRILLNNTEYDLEGGDLSPGRAFAVNQLPQTPQEIGLIKAEDLIPSLFVPTESALYCPGAAGNPSCGVSGDHGRRDHASCDAICRASNRDPANPRFRNVFSNPSDRNSVHVGMHRDLGARMLAYLYEYLAADGDGYFGASNPYLAGGAPPAGEGSDCAEADPAVHDCGGGGGELPPDDPPPILPDP